MRKGLLIVLLIVSLMAGLISYSPMSSASGKVRLSKKNIMLIKGKSCKIKLKRCV